MEIKLEKFNELCLGNSYSIYPIDDIVYEEQLRIWCKIWLKNEWCIYDIVHDIKRKFIGFINFKDDELFKKVWVEKSDA